MEFKQTLIIIAVIVILMIGTLLFNVTTSKLFEIPT